MNLIKHLALHKKYPDGIPQQSKPAEQEINPIPAQQPINPVPCLNKRELMFDKMMNLAGSSFEAKKKLEVTDLRIKNPIPKQELEELPGQVIEGIMNSCGIGGCNYVSCSEMMLKYHIKTLHSDVTIFPCPHCKVFKLTTEKINSHFKLHGDRLYR